MIKKDELKKAADAKKLSMANAEKDYLLDAVLFSIYSEFGDTLILKGGTSLYKLYKLNRFSEYLDFALNSKKFDAEKFTEKIQRSLRLIGIDGKATAEGHGGEIKVRMYFTGPLYSGNKASQCYVLLMISNKEKALRSPQKKPLAPHPIYQIPAFDVWAMDEADILCEKVRSILTNAKSKDVYDLWFLLKKGVRPDTALMEKKLAAAGKKFEQADFEKRIEGQRALWEKDLRGLILGELPGFERVRNEIAVAFKVE